MGTQIELEVDLAVAEVELEQRIDALTEAREQAKTAKQKVEHIRKELVRLKRYVREHAKKEAQQ